MAEAEETVEDQNKTQSLQLWTERQTASIVNYTKNKERHRIMHQAMRATTMPAVIRATRELDQWVDDYPDDLGIIDAYEILENMKEIAEEQQAERSRKARTEVAA